ncbi:uncharacterized protein FIESC28_04976 [Fusarium coffeatum]|uniref:Uncharacterized protein n=1 Tax=Fusarium coffeatum TaxID=231269 RepID=A0A366RWI9_9HYPO|nr:uncharacterized protein FIESC28_04976 [Fusarium coffeatum]RBR21439.1 hypothetical protein FIESC28_04976 [Fusarium coffeatum]
MYEIKVYRQWKISKLFRTTSESRRVALSFYRVQLPCWYSWGKYWTTSKKTTLYICPELDTLEFDNTHHFECFANDVWTHDRLRVGVVNLAMPSCDLFLHKTWRLGGKNKALFKETLLRIERFIVMERGSRMGWLNRDKTSSIRSPSYHGCPVYGNTFGFERLPCDPRLGDEHLKRIFTGPYDPRMHFHEWFRTLKALGIKHNHKVAYQFGMCIETDSRHDVHQGLYTNDRDAAAEWVRENEQRFQSMMREKFTREGMEYPPLEDQGLEQAPQQAIGFWLFSLESIAPLPKIGTSFKRYSQWSTKCKRHFDYSRFLDMTQHKPELCLSFMH